QRCRFRQARRRQRTVSDRRALQAPIECRGSAAVQELALRKISGPARQLIFRQPRMKQENGGFGHRSILTAQRTTDHTDDTDRKRKVLLLSTMLPFHPCYPWLVWQQYLANKQAPAGCFTEGSPPSVARPTWSVVPRCRRRAESPSG